MWNPHVNIIPTNNDCKVVLGKICSGKNTFSKQFIFHKCVDISDIVRNIVKTNVRVFDKSLDSQIIDELKVILDSYENVVIMGIRQKTILDFVIDYVGNLEIIWLEVNDNELQKRFNLRKSNKDSNITFNEAVNKDNELGLLEVETFVKQTKWNLLDKKIKIINN